MGEIRHREATERNRHAISTRTGHLTEIVWHSQILFPSSRDEFIYIACDIFWAVRVDPEIIYFHPRGVWQDLWITNIDREHCGWPPKHPLPDSKIKVTHRGQSDQFSSQKIIVNHKKRNVNVVMTTMSDFLIITISIWSATCTITWTCGTLKGIFRTYLSVWRLKYLT